jgi:hypothetical protein
MPFSSQARDLNLRGDGCQLGHVFSSGHSENAQNHDLLRCGNATGNA